MKTNLSSQQNEESQSKMPRFFHQRNIWVLTCIILFTIFSSHPLKAQDNGAKESIAVINVDAQGMIIKMPLATSLVTLELEKLEIYEVIDKFDVNITMKQNNFDVNVPYGKTQLIQIGKALDVDKILSGSVEKYGNKIIIILRLIDIDTKAIVKSNVMEYIDQEENIQEMIRISIKNITGIENDKNQVEMLVNFNPPLANAMSKINLSGPRFGVTYTFPKAGDILQAPKNQGGFDMFPLSSTFGYQHEIQFISAGDFQALFEFIGTLNALESGQFIPSLSVLNGFRFNKMGFEFGFGPVFRITKMAEGYYDSDENWILRTDQDPLNVEYVRRLDSRGTASLSTGLIIAAGYTFKSGYLNFPINFYISPRKDGTVAGIILGFNVAKKKKII